MLAAFKAYLESHLNAVDAGVASDVRKVWSKIEGFVTGEEAKVEAEIADLTARGYVVTKAVIAAAATAAVAAAEAPPAS